MATSLSPSWRMRPGMIGSRVPSGCSITQDSASISWKEVLCIQVRISADVGRGKVPSRCISSMVRWTMTCARASSASGRAFSSSSAPESARSMSRGHALWPSVRYEW